MDSSGSIGPDNFEIQRNFLINLVKKLNFTSTRVGIFQYSSRTIQRLILSENQTQVTQIIEDLPYTRGGTNTATALSNARVQLNLHGHATCDRKILLLTDGRASDVGRIPSETRLIQLARYEVIVVGVTDGVDENQLLTLALGVQDNVFKVASFESIGRIIISLQGALVCCEWLSHYMQTYIIHQFNK